MLNKIRKMLKQQEGFTLVELMIVVVILGIISGIGIQQYGQVQKRAQIAAHNANVRIIEGAIQMHIAVEGADAVATEAVTIQTGLNSGLEKYLQEPYPTPEFWEGKTKVEHFSYTVDKDYKVTVTPGRVNDKGEFETKKRNLSLK